MLRCKHQFPYEYFLGLKYLGKYRALEINGSDYLEIKESKKALSAALSMERKYDLLMSNKKELDVALSSALDVKGRFEPGDLNGSYELHRTFALRITNLLSSARMYIDHSKSDIKSCSENPNNAVCFIENKFREHYEKNIYYRLMEALRNHAQHSNIPISGVTLKAKTSSSFETNDLVEIYVLKENLAKNKKFKNNILSEHGDKIEIKSAINSYMQSLKEIHISYRVYSDQFIDKSRSTLDAWIGKYRDNEKAYSDSGLQALHKEKDGSVSAVQVDIKWDDVRRYIVERGAD